MSKIYNLYGGNFWDRLESSQDREKIRLNNFFKYFMKNGIDIFSYIDRQTALGRKKARITIGELEAKPGLDFVAEIHNFVMNSILKLI